MRSRLFPGGAQKVLGFVLLLGGCTTPPPPHQPAPQAAIPGAPRTSAAPVVKVSTQPTEALLALGGTLEIVPLEVRCDSSPPLFVDVLRSVTEARPGLLVSNHGAWLVQSFDDEEQGGWAWVSAAAGCRQLAGAIDTRVESPGWELQVVLSQDGGRTFRRTGTLRKPYYFAQVAGLTMDERGAGEVLLALDDDYGAGVTPGLYRYETRDFGASWSAPRVEPLASLPAPPPRRKIENKGDLDGLACRSALGASPTCR